MSEKSSSPTSPSLEFEDIETGDTITLLDPDDPSKVLLWDVIETSDGVLCIWRNLGEGNNFEYGELYESEFEEFFVRRL